MITTIVKNIVEAMQTGSEPYTTTYRFVLGTKSWLNSIADEKEFPAIAIVTPIVDKGKNTASGYKPRKYPLKMLFIFKSELDWSAEQHDQNCIQPARIAVDKFIDDISQNEFVDKVGEDFEEIEVINAFNVNVSGVWLSLDITLKNTNSICT